MKKRVTEIYFAVLIIGMIYAVSTAFSFRNETVTGIENTGVVLWDNQMEKTQDGDTYYYSRILPSENMDKKVIVYNTAHMYLEVFIDGNLVYSLKGGKDRSVKTTGFYWNIIYLTEEDAGKEIVFEVTPAYRDSKPTGTFFFGTYQEIEHRILTDHLAELTLSGLIALAGIVMLLYGLFVVKKGQDAEIIMQFAIFATMLGIWTVGETQILDWIFPGSIVLVFLSHLMLMSMSIPFVLFLRNMYHNAENKLWSLCCYINCAVIIVRTALQIMGMYDLRETLFLTHIYLLLFVAVIVAMTIHEIVTNKLTVQIKVNILGVMIILVSTLLELALYLFSNKNTPFGSAGFLIYIALMGIVNVRRSRRLMQQARESELYRKLAFTDELTGLSNRMALKEDLKKRIIQDKATGKERILPTAVFMFDLNDLKKCNDTYGHDYGDMYIKMAADALKKIFLQEGKCYRIGGDEFCAWTPYISLDKINIKLQKLEQDVQEMNNKGFVVSVSIAVGYAVYRDDKDGGGLYSTMKRADAMMYEKKKAHKKINHHTNS